MRPITTAVLDLASDLDNPLAPILLGEGMAPYIETQDTNALYKALGHARIDLVILYVDKPTAYTDSVQSFLGGLGIVSLRVRALRGTDLVEVSSAGFPPLPSERCRTCNLGHVVLPWLRAFHLASAYPVKAAA